MKNLTVRFSLMITLGLFTLMLALGAALGMTALNRANDGFALARAIARATQDANDIYKDTARTRAALMRVYADAKETDKAASASEHLTTALKYHDRTLKALQVFVADPDRQRQDARLRKELVAAAQVLSGTLGRAIAALRADDIAAFTMINLKELTPQGAAVSNLLEQFQQESDKLGRELTAQRESEYRMIELLVGVGMALALLLVAVVHVFLKRAVLAPLENGISILEQVARGDLSKPVSADSDTEIGRLMRGIADMQHSLIQTVRQVRDGAHSIDRVAHEVASGNADLSARTETQASSLQETAASMEELTSTVQQTAENTQKARELVRSASDTAAASGDVMGRMVETMAQIDDSSRKVNDIIAVIDGIAFQTNILALNAAVEAARAGEHGRGFAVVASEVRSLAQRSAVAAKEVKDLIENSVDKVRNGSELAEQARRTMVDMAASVQSVADIVISIAEASTEQSAGIAQINQSVTQMDDVTQRNAALVEQAAAATQVMSEQTERLIDAVSVFKVSADPQPVRVSRPALARSVSVTLA